MLSLRCALLTVAAAPLAACSVGPGVDEIRFESNCDIYIRVLAAAEPVSGVADDEGTRLAPGSEVILELPGVEEDGRIWTAVLAGGAWGGYFLDFRPEDLFFELRGDGTRLFSFVISGETCPQRR